MQITKPTFYKEFSCIAGACPDTCCAGWQIMIDEKSLQKYRRFKGPFRNRLHNDIDWKEHFFCQYDKRCAFLNEDNLCDIYSEAGKDMLYILIPYNIFKFITKNQSYVFCFPHVSFSSNSNLL